MSVGEGFRNIPKDNHYFFLNNGITTSEFFLSIPYIKNVSNKISKIFRNHYNNLVILDIRERWCL